VDPESSLELIQRAQSGDEGALEILLARYRPRLQRWARGRLPHYAREMTDTDDLVQEAMVGTFKNFRAFDSRGDWALQAYLRRAVTNRIRDEMRRVASRPRREELDETAPAGNDASPLETLLGKEVLTKYERALASLDEVEREAVIARLELGCSYDEVAALVDRPSADAARMMVSRALAKLARSMPDR
jgi:RNA polymerase sigma factor (sigma-70 family)